ncbi:MAG: Gfo/Idh/MocA family oxidoreductase [Verrucomicrobia bacterium]|nr:Gfo/Idh/MocA family oxidoreductase [Verrucomicrobiota bacterium]
MMADDDYGIRPTRPLVEMDPPPLAVALPVPRDPARHRIGLIGAGGVSEYHLAAYAACGWNVVAIADHSLERARARRDAFFPGAEICADGSALIQREDVTVLDITPHPEDRVGLVRSALGAGKHVLSQKPFALDPALGGELAALAERNRVKLAVNQNGRWAPHWHYLRTAVASGLIGPVRSIDCNVQWDHTWVSGLPRFEELHHLVLFDFAIHWFDIATCLMEGSRAETVTASVAGFPGQRFSPPALGSVIVNYPGAQVRFAFNAHTLFGEEDVTTVVGAEGTLRSRGPNLNEQKGIEVFLAGGRSRVPLRGKWLEQGFMGTMGELLCAIEEDREPSNGARSHLPALELCFAALRSADQGGVPVPIEPR